MVQQVTNKYKMNQTEFEKHLEEQWNLYDTNGSRIVDSFEDDYIKRAFAKGFYYAMKITNNVDFSNIVTDE